MSESTQPTAMRLADEIDCDVEPCDCLDHRAAMELRRLHAANMDCMDHFHALMADYIALISAAKQGLDALELYHGTALDTCASRVITALREVLGSGK